jgi:hypothetical protein
MVMLGFGCSATSSLGVETCLVLPNAAADAGDGEAVRVVEAAYAGELTVAIGAEGL